MSDKRYDLAAMRETDLRVEAADLRRQLAAAQERAEKAERHLADASQVINALDAAVQDTTEADALEAERRKSADAEERAAANQDWARAWKRAAKVGFYGRYVRLTAERDALRVERDAERARAERAETDAHDLAAECYELEEGRVRRNFWSREWKRAAKFFHKWADTGGSAAAFRKTDQYKKMCRALSAHPEPGTQVLENSSVRTAPETPIDMCATCDEPRWQHSPKTHTHEFAETPTEDESK